MQHHGISPQVRPSSSGSTPHDHVTIPQICSSRSLALDRPRPSAPRHPPVVANRPTIYQGRRHPPLIHDPLDRRTTCPISSIPINELARSTQFPIAPAARPNVPLSAVSSFGGFRTPAAEHAAPSLKRPASETLHKRRNRRAIGRSLLCLQERTLSGHARMSATCPLLDIGWRSLLMATHTAYRRQKRKL